MNDKNDYLESLIRQLQKAIEHLDYSHKKIQALSSDPAKLDEEGLETWESYAARFERVADLFITKYLRAKLLIEDPGFSGSVRDQLNFAEKLNLIENANTWLMIRGLRNIAAHEYTEEELGLFFNRLKALAPHLLKIKTTI